MRKLNMSLSWILVLSFLTAPLALADDGKAPQPNDDNVKTVYIIPRAIKANDQAGADAVRTGHVESIEIRFHMKEARLRGGTYFEAIHHQPGQADQTIGSLSYDDYQYSTGLLKKDFDDMWGKMIALRDGASILATGATLYLLWGMAAKLAEKKVVGLSFLAAKAVELYKSKMGFAIMIIPTIEAVKWIVGFYNEFQTNGEIQIPFTTDTQCTQSFLERLAGNDACAKTIQTPWSGFKGKEMAERDWLFRVFSQAYENAKYATPIDAKQFDVDGKFAQFEATLSGQAVAPPVAAPADGSAAQQPQTAPAPIINTVPMSENMPFAITAVKDFFAKYAEDNSEDSIPNDGMATP